jgi:hypothetical protein
MKSLIISIAFLISFSLTAKEFASQYCQFDLPPGWECALEGSEWVCQSLNKDRRKEAIIILAAKIRGSQDSLPMYTNYLKKNKTYKLPGGKTQVSEPKYTKKKNVNSHNWVDSLHLASEVPGFYTRYLATVKADLGVAVTFSVSKNHYNEYQDLFDKIIASLRVFRQKGQSASTLKLKNKNTDLLGGTTFIPDAGNRPDIGIQKNAGKGAGGTSATDIIIYLLIAAAIGFVIKKAKKK